MLNQQKNILKKLSYKDALKNHNIISEILIKNTPFWEGKINDIKARFLFKQTAFKYLPETFATLGSILDQKKMNPEIEDELNKQLLSMLFYLAKPLKST